MKAGVRSARDLTWKDGLDAFTCTECGRCKDACPTHLTGKPLSLKAVNDSLKHHLVEQRDAIVAGDPKNELPALVGGVISEDTLVGLHHLRLLRGGVPDRARAPRQVLPHAPAPGDDRRRVPARAEEGVRGLRVAGQPLGAAGRAARRLGARPRRADRAHARPTLAGLDYLFYVGSAMSFDPRGQKIARAFVAILKQGGRALRHPRRARRLHRRVRAARRQRDAVPAARHRAGRPRWARSASSASSPATRTR